MESHLALTLALVQLGLFALCWLAVMLLMKAQRRPALLFMAACGCDAMTGWLQVTHEGSLQALSAVLMPLALCGATLVSTGADAFVHGRARHLRVWLTLLVLGAGSAWLPLPAALAQVAPLAIYQCAFLLLLVLPVVWLRQPIRQEFGRLGWLALSPFALMGLAVAAFLVHLVLEPADTARSFAARDDHGASSLIPLAVVSGLFHISWLGMMLGRQVVRANSLARIDGLTGVLRRTTFEAELAAGLDMARRLGQPLSLAFLDVDHFKRINDLGGHGAGDRVLGALGQVLRRTLRSTDRCGRWGGEEFVLMLPGVDDHGAATMLQRLTREIAHAAVTVPTGCPPLTVSIGHASWAQATDESGSALIARADAAMYEAKRRGRNTIVGPAGMAAAAGQAAPAPTASATATAMTAVPALQPGRVAERAV